MTNEEAATLLEQWSDEGLSDGFNEAATMGAAALRSPGAAEMREAAAQIVEHYREGRWVDLAAAIRALPLPAPEVPWPVRAYAEWLDDCRNALDDNDVPMKNLRSWIMEEYGI